MDPILDYALNLLLLFFLYSFAGWCVEVTLKFIQYHRFINRGFLTGPICPIYGTGAVLITLAVQALTPLEKAVGTTFAISFVLCGAVEYLTSFVMEKRFHARWWDYSQKPMNLHGRVWIGNLLLFGLGGVLIVHVFNPFLFSWLERIPQNIRLIAAGVLSAVALADYAMTHLVLKLVKVGVEKSTADNTEEISREVRKLLSDRSLFYRRLIDAYPEVTYRTERVKQRLDRIRAEGERLRREAEDRLSCATARAEPTGLIKNNIIEKQDRLIGLLYDEQNASDAAKALKREIDADRQRLSKRTITKIESRITGK